MSHNATPALADTRARPRWSSWGGGVFLAGALVLLAATIVEYFVWQTTTLATGTFVVFSILFFANIVLYLFATFSLAFADGGIAGRSTIGRTGLVLFGVAWAVMQIIYWAWYVVDALPSALDVLSTAALVLAYVGVTAAAVIIALGRVVQGLARWALIIGLAIGAICVGIARAASDEMLTTVLLSISCAAQAWVGLVYLRARPRPTST